uniref:Uncharacterized protein n=1 Tax=Oryza sativa subsp. japonica TaxID=39947 RepID=Q65XR6_ORYSJ|nr:hypothetical protein [Oryza sativa Japonica Group]
MWGEREYVRYVPTGGGGGGERRGGGDRPRPSQAARRPPLRVADRWGPPVGPVSHLPPISLAPPRRNRRRALASASPGPRRPRPRPPIAPAPCNPLPPPFSLLRPPLAAARLAARPRRRRRRIRVAEIHPVHLSSVEGTPKLVRSPTSSSRGLPSPFAIVFLRAGHPRVARRHLRLPPPPPVPPVAAVVGRVPSPLDLAGRSPPLAQPPPHRLCAVAFAAGCRRRQPVRACAVAVAAVGRPAVSQAEPVPPPFLSRAADQWARVPAPLPPSPESLTGGPRMSAPRPVLTSALGCGDSDRGGSGDVAMTATTREAVGWC